MFTISPIGTATAEGAGTAGTMPGVDTHDSPPAPLATPAGRLIEGPLGRILGYQIAQASIVTERVFEQRAGRVHDMRKVEYTVLALVAQNEGLTATQLATALAVTAPNVAAWIDRLVRRGWIEREQHAQDRRALHIRTTAAGREVVAQATEAILEGEAQALSRLTTAERLMLVELLHKAAGCRSAR